jgi:hypothetical protein
MLFIPEVLTILVLDFVFVFFATLAFFQSIKIYKNWNMDATTQEQYNLEKQSYLSATIIKFIFIVKIPLFLFFIFTLDKISNILPGAMCAAGVVDATQYGNYLFVIKIINLYIFGYWLALNSEDIKHEEQPFTKFKFGLFLIIYFALIAEIILEFTMFYSIDPNELVNCCGTIYSSSSNSYFAYLLALKPMYLLSIFYANYLLILLFYRLKLKSFFAFSNIFFIIISIVTLITFFGTYIYELPSHHCPFCLLQSDYYYVGYLLYTLLFLGTFHAICVGFIKTDKQNLQKNYKKSIIFNSLYLLVVSAYPVFYYLKNGVLL